MAKYDLTHARHDPAHCLAPGLFRSLKRGERKREKLDVVYEFGHNQRIEFSGPEPLGADDLRILQGLIAMAGPSGLILGPEPESEAGQQLRLFLDPKWDAINQNALVIKGSYGGLAREVGYTNIKKSKHIRECIERLWKVSIIVQNGQRRQGFKLLSEYASDDEEGKLFIALNPMIATAIMGGQHVRIDMNEIRTLESDAARLIHQRLCAWINPGKSGQVGLKTICSYIWPKEASSNTMKKRKQRAKVALLELEKLGWEIKEYARKKYKIGRPK